MDTSIRKRDFLRSRWMIPLILILGALLRLWGIHFGLPNLYHADEPIVVNHALQFGSGDFNPHFFNIPPLTSYLLFAVYGVLYLCGKVFSVWTTTAQFADYFFRDPSVFYLIGRVSIGVVPAVASIYLLICWMRRLLYSQVWVVVAGLLFAVCFVHVSDSHYIYADILLVFCCLLFFYVLHQSTYSRKSFHLLLGLLVGIAVAFKYNGFFLIAPYLWMQVRSIKHPQEFLVLACIAAAGSLIAFFTLNPFAFIDYSFFIRELKEQNAANLGVPFWHHLTYSLAEGMSWPLLALSLAGGARAFFSKDIKLQSVSFFCLVYYLVLWQKGQPYGRYNLPIVPFLIFLAVDLGRFLTQKAIWIRVIMIVLLVLSVGLNLSKVIRFNWIIGQPDVRTQAAQWIQDNIPSGSRIALDGTSFSPRLPFSCEQLQKKMNVLALSDSTNRKRLQSRLDVCSKTPGFNLFFLSRNAGSNPFLFASPEIPMEFQALLDNQIQYVVVIFNENLRNKIQKEGELIARWSPYHSDAVSAFQYDPFVITGGPFTWNDIFARKAGGYPIDLYALGDFEVAR